MSFFWYLEIDVKNEEDWARSTKRDEWHVAWTAMAQAPEDEVDLGRDEIEGWRRNEAEAGV